MCANRSRNQVESQRHIECSRFEDLHNRLKSDNRIVDELEPNKIIVREERVNEEISERLEEEIESDWYVKIYIDSINQKLIANIHRKLDPGGILKQTTYDKSGEEYTLIYYTK